MHGGEMTVLSTAPCAKCNACAKCKELGAQIRGWCTFSRLHLTGEFCLRISIRWRSMVRCTFSRVRIFAGTPAVTLYQNRTILHGLHHDHTAVWGQPHGDSASSVAVNVTMSTGFFCFLVLWRRCLLSWVSLTAAAYQFVF